LGDWGRKGVSVEKLVLAAEQVHNGDIEDAAEGGGTFWGVDGGYIADNDHVGRAEEGGVVDP